MMQLASGGGRGRGGGMGTGMGKASGVTACWVCGAKPSAPFACTALQSRTTRHLMLCHVSRYLQLYLH